MIITIDCAVLSKAVSHVRSVTGDGKTSAVLANVLLEAADGMLRITATDMSIQIEEQVACEIEEAGETTVSAQRLHDALRYLPPGAPCTLKLTDSDPRMELKCARSRFQLPTISARVFPKMTPDQVVATGELDADGLTRLFDTTAFAADTDSTRAHLCGVFLHTVEVDGDAFMRAVATNGHRLALTQMEAPEGFAYPDGLILPSKTVAEVRKLIDAAGETVEVSFSPTKVVFNLGPCVLISKVISGSYVEYWKVIPADSPHHVSCETDLLTGALKRAMVVSTEKSRSVALEITGGKMTFLARDMEAGEAREELDADLIGDAINVRFNASYLLDATGRIGGEHAHLHYSTAKAPFLITDPADRHAQFVLVPQFGN